MREFNAMALYFFVIPSIIAVGYYVFRKVKDWKRSREFRKSLWVDPVSELECKMQRKFNKLVENADNMNQSIATQLNRQLDKIKAKHKSEIDSLKFRLMMLEDKK